MHYDRPNRMNDDVPVPMDELTERTIRVLSHYLADGSMHSKEQLAVLGAHLFRALFDKNLQAAFKKDLDSVKDSTAVLRLILEFKRDARELAELPWEYIYFPEGEHGAGFFIAAEPESRLILARHVPLSIEDLEPTPQPLKILVVVSQPTIVPEGEELGDVLAGSVVQALEKLKVDHPGAIQTEQLDQPTRRSLAARVGEFKPHVVHFIGHGKYDRENGGSLAFVQEDGQTLAWVNDDELPNFFIPKPRLIFLHACMGAHTESYEAFRGVGLTLAYSRIPAVVAMQYPVENAVANAFATRFYQSLAEGRPIDAAVQDGRKELGLHLSEESYGSRAFGVPVVFLQTADEIISVAKPDLGGEGLETGPLRCPKDATIVSGNFCPNCALEFIPCWSCGGLRAKGYPFCGWCKRPAEPAAVRPLPEVPAGAEAPAVSGLLSPTAAARQGTDSSLRSASGEHRAPVFDGS
jgi:CHAT domain